MTSDDLTVVVWDGTPRFAGGYLLASAEHPQARPAVADDPRELLRAPPRRRGRPPRADTKAVARVEIRMSLHELRGLKALAAANGSSMADLIC